MGLRGAALLSSSNAAAMAPALAEPISHSNFHYTALPGAAERPDILVSNGQFLKTKPPGHLNENKANFDFEIVKKKPNGPSIGSLVFEHMDQTQEELDCTIQSSPPSTQSYQHNPTTPPASSTPLPNSGNISNMGLQKDYLKDNPDMDQMLGDLVANSEMDLLQVFKNLPNSDNLGDLGLFNDVDVMNMNIGLEDVSVPPKEPDTQDIRNEIKNRHAQMVRKCDFLVRRLRKLQARSMGQHINEEINGLFEHTQKVLKQKERETKSISTMTPISQSDKQKQIASCSLSSLLKRIETVASDQQSTLKKFSGTSAAEIINGSNKPLPVLSIVPTYDVDVMKQLDHSAGLLQTELKLVVNAIDSDVTASSSGGESADEMVTYNNPTQEQLTIAKRAAYRWARDRSGIASRWSWLLAQISDLDYRIRQHTELHQQIKKNKGAVKFEEAPVVPQQQQQSFTGDTDASQSLNGYRGTLPGNSKLSDIDVSTAPNPTNNNNGAYTDTDGTCGASRTRAFLRNEFRKRKLLQTSNLHTISKKAARQSTVKCGCQWPLYPCALCTGRQDPTAPRDIPDMISKKERIGLLDPGFHPVISFPDDASQSIHLESTLRQPDFQTKAFRSTTKAALRSTLAIAKSTQGDERSRKSFDGPSKKKYNAIATKLKKKAKKSKSNHRSSYSHMINHKVKKRSYHGMLDGNSYNDQDIGPNGAMLPRSKNPSPTHGIHRPEKFSYYTDRRARNSYDIDNIVIPYSVAAATRVEILKCKEIPTPKWRLYDDEKEEEVDNSIHEKNESAEDITLEALYVRHDRASAEERKKFSTFLKFPWSTRSRANRRTDSQADSSGANTPDPMSPAPKTPSVSGDHESIPSPAAPSNPLQPSTVPELSNTNSTDIAVKTEAGAVPSGPSNGNILHPGSVKLERRRTVSVKKPSADDGCRYGYTVDTKDAIPPYEQLEFPLSDEAFESMLQMMPSPHQTLNDMNRKHPNIDSPSTIFITNDTAEDITTEIVEHEHMNSDYNFAEFVRNESCDISGASSHILLDTDSETESIESGIIDEDPNDPEWCEPPSRL